MKQIYRIKVFQDYPNNPYPIGEVVEVNKEVYDSLYDDKHLSLSKFPNIIKIVQWWEYHSKEELSNFPKYVKIIHNGEISDVRKVDSWLFNPESDTVNGFTHSDNGFPNVSLNHWSPAIEEEYLDFKKLLKYVNS